MTFTQSRYSRQPAPSSGPRPTGKWPPTLPSAVQHALKRDVPAAPPTHDAQERWRELELKRRNRDLERRALELNDEIEASANPEAIIAELSPETRSKVEHYRAVLKSW